MREIDSRLKSRILQAQQTVYNNAEPKMEIVAVRPRTAIFHERYWQESVVTAGVTAVCTSVAIRRTGRWGDTLFVAYVDASGVLTVKSAPFRFPIRMLSWTTLATIPGCTACALEFEGRFVHIGRNVEFRTDALPYLFYVTSAGALIGGILGGLYETLASANVTAVDAINGVSNTFRAQNQGFFVFYIANGIVYYNTLLNSEWLGQEAVGLAPVNAVAIKAERTFDWRIVLQIKDSAGALWEVFGKMESTGWNGTDFISLGVTADAQRIPVTYIDTNCVERIDLTVLALALRLHGVTTHIVEAVNLPYTDAALEVEDDYGYLVRVTFDAPTLLAGTNAAAFTLTDEDDVVYGAFGVVQVDSRTLDILFQNFNNAAGDLTLDYTPGVMVGEAGQTIDADAYTFTPSGLVPVVTGPPVPISAENIEGWLA